MKTQDIKNMAGALQQVREGKLEEMSSKEKMKRGLYDAKMDPVGKADADIDNDGDVDKSDKYLHNRRKAISKNVKKGDDNDVIVNPKRKKGEGVDEAKRQMAAKMPARRNGKKGAPKMTGDSIAIQRAKDAEHNDAMGRTKTGRKKPVRTMTSTQRSLASMRNEGTQEQSWPVYARILEKNSEHYKGTAPNDKVDDLDSPGAAKMRADIKGEVIDYQKMSVDSMQAALKAGPVSNAQRPNDNKAGDKSVVSPVKGKT
jgi:hypothetical protein